MKNKFNPFYLLQSERCSLVIDCTGNAPVILYWGIKLAANANPEMLALLTTRQEAQACIEKEVPITLSPELGAGFSGNAGLQIHREGKSWGVYTQIKDINLDDNNNMLTITSVCEASQISLIHRLILDRGSDMLIATTELVNHGTDSLWVEQCNAPCIPLPLHYDQILGFEGRWSNEFQLRQVPRFLGSYLRENRAGRTSHQTFPGLVIHTKQTNESIGGAFGLHLGWSGNNRIRIESLSDGRAFAQLGELFLPGELVLQAGETYLTPALYSARSHDGFSGLSRCFHRYVRQHLTDRKLINKPRPVYFNTWEAMYFDVSLDKLYHLVDEAAAIGVERFVLDDGWFRNRHSEQSGLGDWYVDEKKFPDGLNPLIQYVLAKGMEFGLWIEPEMVNLDSDLYRQHPDWVLNITAASLTIARHQLVLDLTREEVQNYLFQRLDALLNEYKISYLKWDMNRDVNQPGGKDDRAVAHYQVLAFYDLMMRVRQAHPDVEIESCASGGGRADYGVLAYTDRIWTSDTNDALDRLRIQKGFSFFFPPEMMGAHIGPFDCHTTGRKISMATRAGVAMFGNMGIETNLLELNESDKAELMAAVSLYKKHRKLILHGELIRLDLPAYESGFGIIAPDQQQAMFSYALLNSHPNSAPGRLRFRGLLAMTNYTVNIIWPLHHHQYSTSILDRINGAVISGDALMKVGMQLPIMRPESLLIIHLQSHNHT